MQYDNYLKSLYIHVCMYLSTRVKFFSLILLTSIGSAGTVIED